MAKIEVSVFSRERLDRRIPDVLALTRRVAALEMRRNEAGATVDWRFTSADARVNVDQHNHSISA